MSNFGFLDLRLVDPYDVAWREARSAVGAAAVVGSARVFPSLAEAIADCSLVVGTASLGHRDLKIMVRRLDVGARLIRKRTASEKAALLFGSEKFGLSNEDLSHCHWLLRIPTRAEHESMNLGQAVALCLYEIGRTPPPSSPNPAAKATAGDLAEMEQLLSTILMESGYTQPTTAESSGNKLRRFLRRMELTRQDTSIWLGMLKQIHWKLSHRTKST